MEKIIEYTNLMCGIDDTSLDSIKAIKQLTECVKDYTAFGWEPIGGIVIGSHFVVQTMVKR